MTTMEDTARTLDDALDGLRGRLGQALSLVKAALGDDDAGEQGDVVV